MSITIALANRWAIIGLVPIQLAIGSQLSAQETHAVAVRVQSHAEMVAGATVKLAGRQGVTSSTGVVQLRAAKGRHELRVERLGYASFVDSVTISSDTTLTVSLEEQALEAEEVVVTSTRGERRVQDEPVKVEVVTREEVEEKLLMTPGSISMLLNETSGLRVQETSPALGGAIVRVQGLHGRYTPILSDGLPLYGGQAGSFGLLQIPPMDLAQVEVIKGAASSLYGSSALGGVVNLISRRPADEDELLLNQTTRGGSDLVLWHSRELSEVVGYTLLGSGHVQRDQDIDRDRWQDIPEFQRVNLRPRFYWTPSPSARLMATVGAMFEDRTGGGVLPDSQSFQQKLQTSRIDAGVTGRLLLPNSRYVDLRGSTSRIAHEHTYGATLERDLHLTGFGEVSLRGVSGKHAWVVGGAIQRDRFRAEDVSGFDYAFWVPSLFLQDELTISGALTASLSARHDWHSEYGSLFTPRASLLVRPFTNLNARLTLGRGFYGPTALTSETEEVGLSNVEPGNTLRAESATLASVDVNWVEQPFEVNLSVFGSRIDDAVQTFAAGSKLRVANLDGITRTSGAEALIRFKREPFSVTAAHTYVDATESGVAGGRLRVPLTPRHSSSLVAVVEEHGEGRAGLEVYYTGRQLLEENPYRDWSKPYLIVGVLVEKRVGTARVFLNFENITNVRQTSTHPLIRGAATSYGRWTTDLWAPVEGRTLNGGIRLTF